LRDEDRKKCVEVAALLNELSKINRSHPLVDVAAGKAYVGLLAAELLGFEDVTVIERDPRRIADVEQAAKRLRRVKKLTLREADVGDVSAWPTERATVVGLHACGPASDAIIDVACAREVRWLLLVPCCYSAKLTQWNAAHALADRLGVPEVAAVRSRFIEAMVDAERTLRLEARGFQTEVVPFVAPTVTPHNRLFRARRTANPTSMQRAGDALARLLSPHPTATSVKT
jgi:hypothetical protein